MNTVTNMRGDTYTVGDRVKFIGVDGFTGTIIGISLRFHVTLIQVDPDNIEDVPRHMCWKLNPELYPDQTHYCKPRDPGLSMGNWEVIAATVTNKS